MGEEVTYMPELTIKEVVQILKHNYEDEMRYHYPNKLYAEAMRIGYTELEKQIPKPPKMYVGEYEYERHPTCRNCGESLMPNGEKYCSECGQKIDWR
jgi:hypothetical protein